MLWIFGSSQWFRSSPIMVYNALILCIYDKLYIYIYIYIYVYTHIPIASRIALKEKSFDAEATTAIATAPAVAASVGKLAAFCPGFPVGVVEDQTVCSSGDFISKHVGTCACNLQKKWCIMMQFTIAIGLLVGGLEPGFYFSIGNFIIPTDELMFVRGVETTKLYWYIYIQI